MALTKISAGAHNVDTLSVGTSDAPPKPLLVDGGADYNVVLRSASGRSGLVMHAPRYWVIRWPSGISFAVGGQYFQTRHDEPLQYDYGSRRSRDVATTARFRRKTQR